MVEEKNKVLGQTKTDVYKIDGFGNVYHEQK